MKNAHQKLLETAKKFHIDLNHLGLMGRVENNTFHAHDCQELVVLAPAQVVDMSQVEIICGECLSLLGDARWSTNNGIYLWDQLSNLLQLERTLQNMTMISSHARAQAGWEELLRINQSVRSTYLAMPDGRIVEYQRHLKDLFNRCRLGVVQWAVDHANEVDEALNVDDQRASYFVLSTSVSNDPKIGMLLAAHAVSDRLFLLNTSAVKVLELHEINFEKALILPSDSPEVLEALTALVTDDLTTSLEMARLI